MAGSAQRGTPGKRRHIPNLLTAARLAAAAVFVFLFAAWGASQGNIIAGAAAIFLIFFAMITDYLDGHLARKLEVVSNIGKLFDPLADCIFFICVFSCFAWAEWMPVWMLSLIVAREAVQHLVLRPLAFRRGTIMAARWTGKVKTTVIFIVSPAVMLSITIAGFLEADVGSVRALMTISWFALLLATVASVASLFDYIAAVVRMNRVKQSKTQV